MKILGIKITPAEPWELHMEITRLIEEGGPGFVLSGNVHGINLAQRSDWLAQFYGLADLVRVDGAGVVLGAKMLGRNIPKRLTWADWGWMLASYLAEQQHSVYLLGGPLGAASETAKRLKERSPTLRITGTHHGYFQKSGAENMRVIKQINDLNPDVLVVGMGMPLQEEWILRNHSQIRAKVFVTAGAAFEYLSGSLRRCPQWMADSGMEWLFRLLLEPKRMARRYLLGNTIFLFSVVRERFGMLKV